MRRIALPALASAVLGIAALSGCSATDATTAGASTAASSTPVTAPTTAHATGEPVTSAKPSKTSDNPGGNGQGCSANGKKIPAGAHMVTTDDLDHDGRKDKLFLTQSPSQMGVRTATGKTFTRTFSVSEASEVGAQAFVVADGSSLILLSGSRQSYLFAVVDCEIVVTKNVQGEPYTFDNGFTKPGTGVGCLHDKNGLTLVGLLAAKDDNNGKYDITRTVIEPQHFGTSARNGQVTGSDLGLSRDAAFAKIRTGFPCTPAPAA